MGNLRQVYTEGRDVRDSDIPQEWKESWLSFMSYQTCALIDNEKLYYANDFRRWYHQNQKAIERDIKIDQIYE